jgi:cyclomaltodextrinase / maltogenic alpha-amylase / neopullulanase
MKEPIITAGRYRHYKGKVYKVIGIAKHSDTLEQMVVFRAVEDERQLWCQPLEEFKGKVRHEGSMVPMFEYLGALDE